MPGRFENPSRFENKVALITGGNSGIGRATALAFAREGAKVVIAARREAEGEETVELAKSAGGEAMFVRADMSSPPDIANMVSRTVAEYGSLDIAFNNAGRGGGSGETHEVDEETFDAVMAVNVKAVWLCMKHQITQMLEQGAGVIVNNASVAGLRGVRGGATYATSKHAVVGLTKSTALEYVRRNIRINAVCPGYVRTPMVQPSLDDPERGPQIIRREPIGRVGTPDEVADAVLWLCSDGASFMIGHTMPVDGGIMAG